LLLGPTNNRR